MAARTALNSSCPCHTTSQHPPLSGAISACLAPFRATLAASCVAAGSAWTADECAHASARFSPAGAPHGAHACAPLLLPQSGGALGAGCTPFLLDAALEGATGDAVWPASLARPLQRCQLEAGRSFSWEGSAQVLMRSDQLASPASRAHQGPNPKEPQACRQREGRSISSCRGLHFASSRPAVVQLEHSTAVRAPAQ